MKNQIALIRKLDQRVDSVIIVDSVETSYVEQWATNALDVVVVMDSIPYVNGLWDGTNFHNPENEYLVSNGFVVELEENNNGND